MNMQGRYQATPVSVADNKLTDILTDANGRVAVSGTVTPGVTMNAGVVDATTQRVAIATNANVVDTELPAAAALSDAAANPTTPTLGAVALGWDGTNVVRLKATADKAIRSDDAGVLLISAKRTTSGALLAPAAGRRLCGFSAVETAGAAATIALRHGDDNADPEILWINLSASQAVGDFFTPVGVASGVYFHLLTGAASIVAHYKDVT